jgi:hypothetical protein
MPGVTAAVRQENADDHLDVAVPSDLVTEVGPAGRLRVRAHAAPPGYFSLMGIPVIRGRGFETPDEADGSTVVIGAELAQHMWGSADPIGRRLVTVGPDRQGVSTFRVVGVVDGAPAGMIESSGEATRVFVPRVRATGHLLIRTHGPAQPVIPAIRSSASAEAPELPVVSARTLAAIEADQRTSIVRVIGATIGVGVVALVLSAIGLYAVVAFAVGQRVREIGIRTALGADGDAVVRMFLRRGLRLGLFGLFVGLSVSVMMARLIAAARGQSPEADTLPLAAAIAFVVAAVAVLATWIPARRAARIDAIEVLRTE